MVRKDNALAGAPLRDMMAASMLQRSSGSIEEQQPRALSKSLPSGGDEKSLSPPERISSGLVGKASPHRHVGGEVKANSRKRCPSISSWGVHEAGTLLGTGHHFPNRLNEQGVSRAGAAFCDCVFPVAPLQGPPRVVGHRHAPVHQAQDRTLRVGRRPGVSQMATILSEMTVAERRSRDLSLR